MIRKLEANTKPPAAGNKNRKVAVGRVEGPNLRAVIAKNARAIRAELGLTQEQMGERSGIRKAYIGEVEKGNQNLTVDSLSNLAAGYGIPAHDFIFGPGYADPASGQITLDTLARLTGAIHQRVEDLLAERGPVPVGKAVLASVVGALFDAVSRMDKYTPGASAPKNDK